MSLHFEDLNKTVLSDKQLMFISMGRYLQYSYKLGYYQFLKISICISQFNNSKTFGDFAKVLLLLKSEIKIDIFKN